MICSCACSVRVWATNAAPGFVTPADAGAQPLQRFDIAAQSLQSALEAYGALTDVSLLYDSSLTAGRRSTPVQGEMTARAALQLLLEGSGLTPRYTGEKTVALVPARQRTPDMPSESPGDAAHAGNAAAHRYFGLVQARVHDAFCAQPLLAQGTRRIALRLWIDASGAIGPVSLLASSGDLKIDKLVVTALQGVRIGEPVPPSLAQPFTFVVLPRASGRTWGCVPANDAVAAPDEPPVSRPARAGGQHGR